MSASQQLSQTEDQRINPTSPSTTGATTFTNVFDIEGQRAKTYGTIDDDTPSLGFVPKPVLVILGSTYCFIILCILLVFPILHVAIGGAYRDQCPINPNIPVYLIVAGSCGMASVLLVLIIVGAFIWCIKLESVAGSLVVACLGGLVFAFITLMSVFLFAWFIVGNVWVFGAKKDVVYDDPNSPNYCNRTLYDFAFAVLILSYVMTVLSCCGQCFRACCQGGRALSK